MILGSKPLAQLTPEELDIAIRELREAREALRDAAIERKRKSDAGEHVPREPRKPHAAPKADPFATGIMDILKGE